jgi:hypothetical protein
MGRRHQKKDTGESKDLWSSGDLRSTAHAGLSAEPLPFRKAKLELTLPPWRTVKWAYRQLGSFRGRKVWESSLNFSYFH